MGIIPLKHCNKCDSDKPATIENFHVNKRTGNLFSPCRDCQRIIKRDYRLNNPDKVKASNKEWVAKNPDKLKATQKRYYDRHPERRKAARQKWRKDNPDKARLSERKWRDENREHLAIYNQKNLDHKRLWTEGRLARKRSLPNTFTDAQWANCLEYFGNCCAVCGRQRGLWHTLAIDHWIPLSSPDCPGTIADNCIPLCHGIEGCNNSKCNRDATEWLTSKYSKRKASAILKRITDYFESVKCQ